MHTRPALALPSARGSLFVSRSVRRNRASRLLRTTALSCALLMPGMAEARSAPKKRAGSAPT